MTEKWLPIKDFEGWYSVSDMGRVRSETRILTGTDGVKQVHKGQILKAGDGWNGRPIVSLRKPGCRRTRSVHQLVLETFTCPRPKGKEVLHWDDDPHNNQLSNLRWGTRSENLLDRKRNGNDHYASRTRCDFGHEFSPENTVIRPEGSRRCRECKRRRGREYWERKRIQKESHQQQIGSTT